MQIERTCVIINKKEVSIMVDLLRSKSNDPVWGSDGSDPDPDIIAEECGGNGN